MNDWSDSVNKCTGVATWSREKGLWSREKLNASPTFKACKLLFYIYIYLYFNKRSKGQRKK